MKKALGIFSGVVGLVIVANILAWTVGMLPIRYDGDVPAILGISGMITCFVLAWLYQGQRTVLRYSRQCRMRHFWWAWMRMWHSIMQALLQRSKWV